MAQKTADSGQRSERKEPYLVKREAYLVLRIAYAVEKTEDKLTTVIRH